MTATPLRIGLLAPVWFPVPPTAYGGIERVVSLLADGLVAAGHDVTLFASGDSRTRARLVSVYERAPSAEIGRTTPELRHALACFERADEFDVVNDHSGPVAAAVAGLVSTAVVHTVHGPLTGEEGDLYERIAAVSPTVGLISLSLNQRKPCPDLPWIANCPNALDLAAYPVSPDGGDYLCFSVSSSTGRMTPVAAFATRTSSAPARSTTAAAFSGSPRFPRSASGSAPSARISSAVSSAARSFRK